MSIYKIKQATTEYSDSVGLSKYNRSRMPGCKDVFQAAIDNNGAYITGIDESELDSLSKYGYDFSNRSDFWENFSVSIFADSPKEFNSKNVLDYVGYKMLVANGYIAPNYDALGDYKYKDALYYSYNQDDEDTKEISTVKIKDKARSFLLDISDNKDRMLLYGQYLEGIKYTDKLHEPTIYKMLRSFIDESLENAKVFLSLKDMPVEDLQSKIIVDKAIKKKIIKKVSTGKNQYAYQYGQVTLGNTVEDLYKNLLSVDFASELFSINKELNK